MLKSAAMTIVLAMLLSPHSATASPWTEGQAEWFKHGRWDCYGKCPEGRVRNRETQRSHHRPR
ncbi:hypothetical protein [Methylocystis hirsuta]|uniref:Uncharacterized protein n=1 Tax=Methylocystis hirsuta TaxID=369798 RepID=A0A3M9XPY9_9HYPH|nr:hypothetical protein [Methylocystis hirsuta]RNJ49905.1 hypothetical protein D1O30_10130 [Methylocystis hirsuta]